MLLLLCAPRWGVALPLFVISFLCYLAINARFFGYLLKTEGAPFTLAAVCTHWANSVVIVAGVAWGTLTYVLAHTKGGA